MATRTLANGGGNWNDIGTWVEGAVPTSADEVVATGTSGNLTINAAAACRSIDLTGYVGTVTHNAAITLSIGDGTAPTGNNALVFPSSGWTYTLGNASTSAISFVSTSATQLSINPGGKTFGGTSFNGAAGSWALAGSLVSSGSYTISAGTFDAAGYDVTATSLVCSGSTARTLTMGSGTWTLTGNATTVISGTTVTNFTLNKGSLPIVCNYSGSTGTRTVRLGNSESTAFDIKVTAGTDIFSLFGSGTCIGSVTLDGFAGTLSNVAVICYGSFTIASGSSGATLTAGNNALTLAATSGTKTISSVKTLDFPVIINGVGGTFQLGANLTMGSTRTLTVTNGTFSGNGYDLSTGLFASSNSNTRTVTIGAGTWTLTGNAATILDIGTVTNLTFNPGAAIVCSYAGSTGTRTVSVGGGLAEASAPSFSVTAGSDTVNFGSSAVKDVNFTGFTGTAGALSRVYGNMTFGSGMTAAGCTFTNTSGTKTLTSNSVSMTTGVTISGSGGTVQLADALATAAITRTAGTFIDAGFAVNVSGNWTNTAGAGSFTLTGTTTLNKTSGTQTIAGSTTFTNLVATAAAARAITFTDGTTQTVSNSLTLTGSSGQLLTLQGSSTGGWTLAVPATQSLGYLSVSRSTATGNTALAGVTSTDGGNNTNWNFGPPVNSVAPSCTPSSGTVADTFTFAPGTWTGSPTSYETSVSVDGGAYSVIDTSAGGNPSKTGTQLGGPGSIATRVRAENAGGWSDYVAGTTLTVTSGGAMPTNLVPASVTPASGTPATSFAFNAGTWSGTAGYPITYAWMYRKSGEQSWLALSTSQNPTIPGTVFPAPGTYDTQVTATNTFGSTTINGPSINIGTTKPAAVNPLGYFGL